MKMFALRTLAALVLTLQGQTVLAAEVRLFNTDGSPVANYNDLVEDVATGDTILFSDSSMKVGRRLDNGMTNANAAVFEVHGDPLSVVKIPQYQPTIPGEMTPTKSLNSFITGYNAYAASGMEVTELKAFKTNQFVVTERIRMNQTFVDFIAHAASSEVVPDFDLKLQALREFSFDTGLYGRITAADVHAANIAWDLDKKRWVVFDWMESPHITTDGKLAYSPEIINNASDLRRSMMHRNFADSLVDALITDPTTVAGSARLAQIEDAIVDGVSTKAAVTRAILLAEDPDFLTRSVESQRIYLKGVMDNTANMTTAPLSKAFPTDTNSLALKGKRVASFLQDMGVAGIFTGLGVGLDMYNGMDFKGAVLNQFFPSSFDQMTDYLGTPLTWAYTLNGMANIAPSLLNGAAGAVNMSSAFFRLPPSASQTMQYVLNNSAKVISSNNALMRANNLMRAAQAPLMMIQWGVLVGQSAYGAMTDPGINHRIDTMLDLHNRNYQPDMLKAIEDVAFYMKANGTSEHAMNGYLGLVREKMRSDFTNSVVSLYQAQPTELNAVFLMIAERVINDPSVRSEDLPAVVEAAQRKYLEYHQVDLKDSGDISNMVFKLGSPVAGGDAEAFSYALIAAKNELDLVNTSVGISGGPSDLQKIAEKIFGAAEDFRNIRTTADKEAFKLNHPTVPFNEAAIDKQIAAYQFLEQRENSSTTSTNVSEVDEDILMLEPFLHEENRIVKDRLILNALGGVGNFLGEVKGFVTGTFRHIGNFLGLCLDDNCPNSPPAPLPYIQPEDIDSQVNDMNAQIDSLMGSASQAHAAYNTCVNNCNAAYLCYAADGPSSVESACGHLRDESDELMNQAYALQNQIHMIYSNNYDFSDVYQEALTSDEIAWAGSSFEDPTYGEVIGHVDSVSSTGEITGWACAKYIPVANHITVSVGSSQTVVAQFYANVANETAVTTNCKSMSTAHRFRATLPASVLNDYPGQSLQVKATSLIDDQTVTLPSTSALHVPAPTPPPSPKWAVVSSSSFVHGSCLSGGMPQGACTVGQTATSIATCVNYAPGMYNNIRLHWQCQLLP